MRVERDAVGLLDAAEQCAAFVAQREQAAVGAINMQPGAVAAAQLGDFRQRIDRAGVDGAGGSDHQPRSNAIAAVLLERLLERVERHAVGIVGRNHPFRRPAPAGDLQRFVDAIMGEAGQIDRAAAVGIARLARGDDRGQIGDASARGQRSGGVGRIIDDAGKPGGAGVFDPNCAGARGSEAGIFV